jgi:hypothetical protein
VDLGRTVSALFALTYLGIATFLLINYPSREGVMALLALLFILTLSLGMIWNGDQWGGTGAGLNMRGISRYTPGCGVVLVGWGLLMIPIMVALLVMWIHWNN